MRIVLLTQITSLIEHCTALADGVGVNLDVRAPHTGGWQGAVLILVGEDVISPPPTGAVPTILVAFGEARNDADLWANAARMGVDHVVALPNGAEWLTQRLINAVEPPSEPALTHGIVAGAGGAGASVLASALARRCANAGIETVLMDADPLGGGLDLVLGCENVDGLRWPALAASRGRLRPSTLQQALPRAHNLAVLSWGRDGTEELDPAVFDTVLTAAQQAFELVIVDLPRHAPISWAKACHRMTLVTQARVRAAVAATSVARRLTAIHSQVGLVVRETGRSGLDPELLADAVGLELVGTFKDDAHLAEQVDRGEGIPAGKTNLGRFVDDLITAGFMDVPAGGEF